MKKDKAEKNNSTKIFIGLIIGGIIGYIFNIWGAGPLRDGILKYVVSPVGIAFLRALFMVVVPLVFCSLVVGVAQLGNVQNVGRLGGRLISFYLITTLFAVLIGQFFISTVRPGDGVSAETRDSSVAAMQEQVASLQAKSTAVNDSLWPGLVEKVIPKNIISEMAATNMLAIIFVAILLGIALLAIDKNKSKVAISFFDAISDACIVIVGWIMRMAPYCVAALIITAVSNFGLEVMKNVALYIGVVIAGYLTHFFVSYSLIMKFIVKIPIKEFYKRILPIVSTAFGTSSSSATMPTTIRTLEKNFGVPEKISSFSVPLGATVNMDGTALFEVIAALFIAQVFGVEISLTGQFTLVILVLLTSIGVAGVPGGSIPILISAMASLGIPPAGIALILGVDRLLDMGRTVVNVTGDAAGALYLSKIENVDLNGHIQETS